MIAIVTLEQLRAICPRTPPARLALFVEPLNDTFGEFAIDTMARQAAFLAQVAHESMGFQRLREIASGAAYDVGRLAERLGNTPEDDGDGERYRGRGLMQITGRRNYGNCGKALGLPLLEQPELLEEPLNAARSAGWFWTVGAGLNLGRAAHAHGIPDGVDLNSLADNGDFQGITLAINGGLNGMDDRVAHFERAQGALA